MSSPKSSLSESLSPTLQRRHWLTVAPPVAPIPTATTMNVFKPLPLAPAPGPGPTPTPVLTLTSSAVPPSPPPRVICKICDGVADLVMPCCGDCLCSDCVSRQVASRAIDRYGGKRCALCRQPLSLAWTVAVTARAAMRRERALQDRNATIASILGPSPRGSQSGSAKSGTGHCDLCHADVTSLECHVFSANHLRAVASAAKRAALGL